LSGLGCALRLAAKKYRVEIFEAGGEIGGGLDEEMLADVRLQFSHEHFELHPHRTIKTREELNALGFDAVFAATGAGGADFGLLSGGHSLIETAAANGTPPFSQSADRRGLSNPTENAGTGWFAGGALAGGEGVYALAQGLHAGAVIDAFLRTGNPRYIGRAMTTSLQLAPFKLENYKRTRGDAENEAARCLKCRCDACMAYCDMPAYTGKWPPRIKDEVFATTLPGKAEVKATPARRLINADNLSGVFQTVCPVGIDLDSLLLAGRQSMHRQEKMPWAFHDFWLRDMEHADSSRAALLLQRGKTAAASETYAFFPGCQIGASNPDLAAAAWQALKSQFPGSDAAGGPALSGLLLRCCGAPAEWAGDEELFQTKLHEIEAAWKTLGRPTLIMACPSCTRKFAERLPKIPTISLYEILAKTKGDGSFVPASEGNCSWAVFDPCAAARLKDADAVRQSVRALAASAGLTLAPLRIQDRIARCCGFGGQPDLADPDFARHVAQRRAEESELPYITYCVNCRDAFDATGKQSKHILEILFPEAARDHRPTASERRANREQLKTKLQAYAAGGGNGADGAGGNGQTAGNFEKDGTGQTPFSQTYGFELEIADDLLARMDKDHILIEEAYETVAHLLKTGRQIRHPNTGVRSGSHVVGKMTYWADYAAGAETKNAGARAEDSTNSKAPGAAAPSYRLTGIYAHRMAIDYEKVWNGVPQT
jgi:Fe-S oxidoreductase